MDLGVIRALITLAVFIVLWKGLQKVLISMGLSSRGRDSLDTKARKKGHTVRAKLVRESVQMYRENEGKRSIKRLYDAKYTYQVNGKTYTKWFHRFLYEPTDEIEVLYDKDPGKAFLPGAHTTSNASVFDIICFIVCVIGASVVYNLLG